MGDRVISDSSVSKLCPSGLLVLVTDLAHGGSEEVDDPLVRDGHHALPVDLDDPVSHPHPAPLRDPAAQQTADLQHNIRVL